LVNISGFMLVSFAVINTVAALGFSPDAIAAAVAKRKAPEQSRAEG
jgi:hypothetical protein